MDNGMISVSMMCVHLGQIKEYLDAFKRNNIESPYRRNGRLICAEFHTLS